MAKLIRAREEAGNQPLLTFIVGKTMMAPDDAPEECGFLSVYQLPCGKFLFTELDTDLKETLPQVKRMAERYSIPFIHVIEVGGTLPQHMWD